MQKNKGSASRAEEIDATAHKLVSARGSGKASSLSKDSLQEGDGH